MTDVWPNGAPPGGDAAELSRTVGDTDIALFTEISGDRNPLHYDEAAAKASRFGEIVVQGGITSAILNAVVAEKLPGPGTVFLNVNWAFKAPVRCGDTITGRVEVISARTAPPAPATTEPSSWAEKRFATRWISPPASGDIPLRDRCAVGSPTQCAPST